MSSVSAEQSVGLEGWGGVGGGGGGHHEYIQGVMQFGSAREYALRGWCAKGQQDVAFLRTRQLLAGAEGPSMYIGSAVLAWRLRPEFCLTPPPPLAENHIKTNSLGLQFHQHVGMSRRHYHKHNPAPFSLYNQSTTASRYISDHKNRCEKPMKTAVRQGPVLRYAGASQGGGSGGKSPTGPQSDCEKLTIGCR